MSGFQEFSKEARLYAEYAAIVDEMYERFKDDASLFLDAVRDRVASQVKAGRLGEDISPQYRSWWIEDDETQNDDTPYIYFRSHDAEIVSPGALKVIASVDGTLKPHRPQFAALLPELRLPETCTTQVGGGGVFNVTLRYGQDDPVAALSEHLLAILTALNEAEKRVLLTPTKQK